jgi:hypothetical protein
MTVLIGDTHEQCSSYAGRTEKITEQEAARNFIRTKSRRSGQKYF